MFFRLLIFLSLLVAFTSASVFTNYWALRRRRYDIIKRFTKRPTIREVQAKHEQMRLRLIRGEPIDGKDTKQKSSHKITLRQ